jgi:proton-translocating NADH-quinone oxidoreductase chain N
MNTPALFWLLVLPLGATPFIHLIGRLSRSGRFFPAAITRWSALAVLLAAWLPFSLAARSLASGGTESFTLGAVSLRMDGLSLLMAALALVLATGVLLFSGPDMAGQWGERKYYALVVALAGTMIGLSAAADLFNLWIWFEAMVVTSYFLVAFYHERPLALEAAVKYLVQSAIGSTFILLGVALVLAQTASLDVAAVRAALQGGAVATWPLVAAGACFLAGFGVKVAIVPLHTWLPDAYSQAPSGSSAMLAGAVIAAGLVGLLRALSPLGGVMPSLGGLLIVLGAVNMLAGNLLALPQKQVKRLLAFSSVSHIGFVLFGLGVALETGQTLGASSALLHLLNHGLMKGLAFLAAGALFFVMRATLAQGPLTIDDLRGAATRYPLAALLLTLAVLSLGGIPPLAGFTSKWQILAAGMGSGSGLIYALVAFAAFNSLLSLAYYLPLVYAVYTPDPSSAVQRGGERVPRLMSLPLAALGLAIVLLGIWPSLVGGLTGPAGREFLIMFAR